MTTLGTMKARIARELGRADLGERIGDAIGTAIDAYQSKRFWFNESRDVTLSTATTQEFYSSSDNANIPDLYSIDYVDIQFGTGDVRQLDRYTEAEIEDVSNAASQVGQPYAYAYYNKKIRLYPVPSTAWTVRIAGQVKVSAPSSDGTTGNPWMTDAERLIRSRAKLELALHVLKDTELAQTMNAAVSDAYTQLKGRTGRQVGRGRIRPMTF